MKQLTMDELKQVLVVIDNLKNVFEDYKQKKITGVEEWAKDEYCKLLVKQENVKQENDLTKPLYKENEQN